MFLKQLQIYRAKYIFGKQKRFIASILPRNIEAIAVVIAVFLVDSNLGNLCINN